MIQLSNYDKHWSLAKELYDTYVKKNQLYGDSFSDSIKEWGFAAAGIRITDKFLRMRNLIHNKNLYVNDTDEQLRDTLLDMANYCIMTVMKLDENDVNKKEKEDSDERD